MKSCLAILLLLLAACATQPAQQSFRATPVVIEATAPLIPTATLLPSRTPTATLSPTPSATATFTVTPQPSATPSATLTQPPSPTQPLFSLTPASVIGAPPAITAQAAGLSAVEGWSCGDFPCEDDIAGFLQRIVVPPGFTVSHIGRFPGQPLQIAYGRDGRLYATVLENGTRMGAVYALAQDGNVTRYVGDFVSPIGLAFQPGTDVLYVSARRTVDSGGVLWRIAPGMAPEMVLNNLPCCFQLVDNQPNGMSFGADGWLYLGVGSLTDRAEPPDPRRAQYATLDPLEAAVLRIQPHTGEVMVYARGIRNPFDVTSDSLGRVYVTDQGLLEGSGDRVLALQANGHFGFPYWRLRGCPECPFAPPDVIVLPDLVSLPDHTLPRGMVAYTGVQFPANYFDNLFVALWNAIEGGQRIVRIEPSAVPADPAQRAAYVPEPFMTGLIRPIDVTIAPDGSLVVADFIYGHVWRVVFSDE
jgi:hypothetical protein